MKTYILKHPVYNSIDFPVGTVVKITDDYWGKKPQTKNTGFTVVQGKLKGEKGCVADGLQGWLVENTALNRAIIRNIINAEQAVKRQYEQTLKEIKRAWKEIELAKL